MIEIIPAIMPRSFSDLEQTLESVVSLVKVAQIDVMDGKFVKARSWPYLGDKGEFEAILKEDRGMPFWDKLNFEADLMVLNPENIINDWISAGASRLIVHIESTKNMKEIVREINERFAYPESGDARDVELGIALNPDTDTLRITEYLEDIDFVQFMGIATIGVQGAELEERVVDKIRDFHNAHPEVIISVDGGVTLENAKLLVEAGAKRLVSGSAIFGSDNPVREIRNFKNIL